MKRFVLNPLAAAALLLVATPAAAFWDRGPLYRCTEAATPRERARHCHEVRPWVGVGVDALDLELELRGVRPLTTRAPLVRAPVRRLY